MYFIVAIEVAYNSSGPKTVRFTLIDYRYNKVFNKLYRGKKPVRHIHERFNVMPRSKYFIDFIDINRILRKLVDIIPTQDFKSITKEIDNKYLDLDFKNDEQLELDF